MKKATSVILIVLAISMLALWINYISLQFDVEEEKTTLSSDFWIFSGNSGGAFDVVANESFFSPLSVSLILSGEGYTSAYNSSLTHTLYENLLPLVKEVLSSSYLCSLSDDTAWHHALSSSDAVLIEYPFSLPYTIISLFAKKTSAFPLGDICSIKSLILFTDENGNLSALSKNGNGDVYSYLWQSPDSPSLVYDFNSNNLAAYTVNKGFTSFVFNVNASDKLKNEKLPAEYKFMSNSPRLPEAQIYYPMKTIVETMLEIDDSSYLEIISDKSLYSILEAFEINPNIVGYYSDSNSGLYFVGQKMTLSMDTSGAISYFATDESALPITVSSLLNSDRTYFTTNELLTAATAFLERFNKFLIGEEASPILDSVSYSPREKTTTFRFSYYYELCEILKDGKKASVSLTFNEYGLVEVEMLPIAITSTDNFINENGDVLGMSLPPSLVSKMLNNDGEFAPVYNFIGEEESAHPLWMEKMKGENKK